MAYVKVKRRELTFGERIYLKDRGQRAMITTAKHLVGAAAPRT